MSAILVSWLNYDIGFDYTAVLLFILYCTGTLYALYAVGLLKLDNVGFVMKKRILIKFGDN